jgi:hypothetical protein
MRWGKSFLVTIGLMLLAYFVTAFTAFNFFPYMVLGTSIWAAFDSSKIEIRKYTATFLGISCGPVGVFLHCILLWIVTFPIYLATRARILAGEAELKKAPIPPAPPAVPKA